MLSKTGFETVRGSGGAEYVALLGRPRTALGQNVYGIKPNLMNVQLPRSEVSGYCAPAGLMSLSNLVL